tara:strand:- start:1822 stop:2340 length:519 start_codon:yes stop_codon:yes gene_type:complete
MSIQSSITEFRDLAKKKSYTIAKINWWLLKYYDLYKYCKDNWNTCSCFRELPCSHTMGSEENKFVDFYKSLEKVADLHKKEPYFLEQLQLFEKVRDDPSALIKWLLHNEKLGAEDFLIFWIEWMEEEDLVNPGINFFPNIEVKILVKEFESTIQFMEVFNELYWTSDIVKER